MSKIFLRLRCGLGNRLLGLLSTGIVAQKIGADLRVIWETDVQCGARLDELFEWSHFRVVSTEDCPDTHMWLDSMFLTGKEITSILESDGVVYLYASSLIGGDLFAAGELTAHVCALFNTLSPVGPVREMLLGLLGARVGVHVRTTDHIPCQLATPLWASACAVAAAARCYGNDNVLLVGDCEEAIGLLAAGQRRDIVVARRGNGCGTTRGTRQVQAALAELLALSKCEVIIASPFSSFAAAAAVFGQAELFQLVAPNPITLCVSHSYRCGQAAWALYRWVGYDWEKDRWMIWTIKRSGPQRAVAWGAFLLVRVLQSRLYQWWMGRPIGYMLLQYRLRRFLSQKNPA